MSLNPDRANPPTIQPDLIKLLPTVLYLSEKARFQAICALQRYAIDNPEVAENSYYREILDEAVKAWAKEFEALP